MVNLLIFPEFVGHIGPVLKFYFVSQLAQHELLKILLLGPDKLLMELLLIDNGHNVL